MDDSAVNTLIIGMLWGDEGKAKIIDETVEEAKLKNNKKIYVVRFQGGPNAGHTMYVRVGEKLEKFVAHAAPSGLASNADIAIGPHVAFDPERFLQEVEEARQKFGYNAGIHISERVGILMDYHRKLDGFRETEGSGKKVGTTKTGIGPFYEDNARRTTRITFADYISDKFPEKLREVLAEKRIQLEEAKVIPPIDMDIINSIYAHIDRYIDKLVERHKPIIEKLKDCSCRLEYRLREALENKENIIIEGAQGTMLDVDMGTIPDTTSSHLLAYNAFASLGLPRNEFKIFGVEKIYSTRVGNGCMPTLADNDFGKRVQERGSEFGATTRRMRRVGYPDWVVSRYSAMVNDLDGVYITRVDVVQDEEIRVCMGYDGIDNFQPFVAEVPLNIEKVKPFYSSTVFRWHLFDWPSGLLDPNEADKILAEKRRALVDGGFSCLPDSLQDYIKKHAEYIKTPIVGISIGPARGETVKKGVFEATCNCSRRFFKP